MTDKSEALAQAIQRVDSLAHAVQIPMPYEHHVDSLRRLLPDVAAELKATFVALTGENPWGGHD